MCTLLKLANRRPVHLISPFLVHEKQITFVGSIGDNSMALVRFSYTVHVFSALSEFFTHFPHFGTFAFCAVPRPHWSSSAMQCNVSAMHCGCGPRELWIICPPLIATTTRIIEGVTTKVERHKKTRSSAAKDQDHQLQYIIGLVNEQESQ